MGWLSLQVALLCACHEHIVKCQQGNSTALWDCVCRLSCFSRVRLFATLWTVAYQAHLSVGFSRQEYWSGLPCPLPGYLLNSGIEPRSFMSSALAGGFFTTSATWPFSPLLSIPKTVHSQLTLCNSLFYPHQVHDDFFFFFLAVLHLGILVSHPEIELLPPAVKHSVFRTTSLPGKSPWWLLKYLWTTDLIRKHLWKIIWSKASVASGRHTGLIYLRVEGTNPQAAKRSS